jgi:hypothetical protein
MVSQVAEEPPKDYSRVAMLIVSIQLRVLERVREEATDGADSRLHPGVD